MDTRTILEAHLHCGIIVLVAGTRFKLLLLLLRTAMRTIALHKYSVLRISYYYGILMPIISIIITRSLQMRGDMYLNPILYYVSLAQNFT